MRIVAHCVFPNMGDAYAAADKLGAAGFDVEIAQDIIARDNDEWLGSSTAFAEAYKDIATGDAIACMVAAMEEATPIVAPFHGWCLRTEPVDPATYVAFAYVDEYEDIRI